MVDEVRVVIFEQKASSEVRMVAAGGRVVFASRLSQTLTQLEFSVHASSSWPIKRPFLPPL